MRANIGRELVSWSLVAGSLIYPPWSWRIIIAFRLASVWPHTSYGRGCRTPAHWCEVGKAVFYGCDMVNQAERLTKAVRQNLQRAQSRQKSYADNQRRPLEFSVGDLVYLKVEGEAHGAVWRQEQTSTEIYLTLPYWGPCGGGGLSLGVAREIA